MNLTIFIQFQIAIRYKQSAMCESVRLYKHDNDVTVSSCVRSKILRQKLFCLWRVVKSRSPTN